MLAEPSASTLPSLASSVARAGSVMRRLSSSPGRRPGNATERDHATFGDPDSCTVGRVKLSGSVAEQPALHAHRDRHAPS